LSSVVSGAGTSSGGFSVGLFSGSTVVSSVGAGFSDSSVVGPVEVALVSGTVSSVVVELVEVVSF
jgi:hypothetical protein